jgi:hypothetical protein
MLRFAMDDSADAKREIVFAVAGILARPGDWLDFESRWDARVKAAGVSYYRTYDCINLGGEFQKIADRYGLNYARTIADGLRADLKSMLRGFPCEVYCLGILMDDWRSVMGAQHEGIDQDPYIPAHQALIGMVAGKIVKSLGKGSVIAFLCDEHYRAPILENSWRDFKAKNPSWAEVLDTIARLDDKKSPCIQVADLIAHATSTTFRLCGNPPDKEIALANMREWLPQMNMLRYFDKSAVELLVESNRRMFPPKEV